MNSSVKQPTIHRVGKVKLSIIMLLIITLPISALMVAVLRSEYDSAQLQASIQQEQIVDVLNKTVVNGVKADMQANIAQQLATRNTLSLDESRLIDHYTSDEFFGIFGELLDNGEYDIALNFVFEELNTYLQDTYGDAQATQDLSRASGLLRDFFVGINVPASECIWLYNNIVDIFGTILDIYDIGSQLWAAVQTTIFATMATSAVNSILLGIKSLCASIPVVGWIALGLITAVEVTIFVTMLVKGSQGKGFKVGFDVKTGWFGIPTGVKWVCQ
jgi:hypothetical protein